MNTASPTIRFVTLTDHDRRILTQKLEQLDMAAKEEDSQAGLKRLSTELAGTLASLFREQYSVPLPHHMKVLVIKNLVTLPDLPETPTNKVLSKDALSGIDALLTAVANALGLSPIAYAFENEGELFRNVVPASHFANSNSSWGYNTTLDWHQDNNFQDYEFHYTEGQFDTSLPPMPRYLLFLALRNSENIPTQLLPISMLLNHIPKPLIQQLMQPQYLINPPESVKQARYPSHPAPLLTEINQDVYGRLDTSPGISAVSDTHTEALKQLRKIINQCGQQSTSVFLAPGDLLLFDNYRVMHRREAFTPLPSKSRWLRRVYCLTDPPSA